MTKLPLIALLAASLVGCAGVPEQNPVVDMKGHTQVEYLTDLSECGQYAKQTASVGEGAAAGAIAGALLGALIYRSVGASGQRGATVGAISGSVGGAVGAGQTKSQIVYRCMAGRGWNVLY